MYLFSNVVTLLSVRGMLRVKLLGLTMKVALFTVVLGTGIGFGHAAIAAPGPSRSGDGSPAGPPAPPRPGGKEPDISLDPNLLPLVYQVPKRDQEAPRPQECTYSAEKGKEGSLHLKLTSPADGVAFRCQGDGDVVKPDDEERGAVYKVASDGSCDTSQSVEFVDVPYHLAIGEDENRSRYRMFVAAGWPLSQEKRLCYVCQAQDGQHAGQKCNIFITIPKAPLTSKWSVHALLGVSPSRRVCQPEAHCFSLGPGMLSSCSGCFLSQWSMCCESL